LIRRQDAPWAPIQKSHSLVLRLDLIPFADAFEHLLKHGALMIDPRWATFLAGPHCLVHTNLLGCDFTKFRFPKALPSVRRLSSYSWKVFGEMYGVRLASHSSPASGKSISASSAVCMYQGFSLCMIVSHLSSDIPQKPEGNQRARKRVVRSYIMPKPQRSTDRELDRKSVV